MELEPLALSVEASGAFDEARAETVVERQNLATLRLLPPEVDERLQALGLQLGEIGGLGKIAVQMKQFPAVGIERAAGRVVRHRFPTCVPQAAMPEHLEILRFVSRRGCGIPDAGCETFAFHWNLRDARD